MEVLPEPRNPASRMVGTGFFVSEASVSLALAVVSEDAAFRDDDDDEAG